MFTDCSLSLSVSLSLSLFLYFKYQWFAQGIIHKMFMLTFITVKNTNKMRRIFAIKSREISLHSVLLGEQKIFAINYFD
uniref:Uncharacterized protein n=1 Tax=Anguilla anguilla TaxID=7936 RepID=A0A0E9W7A9_ANGAN